ncbi:hypothetical protein [Leucobacter sp. NPDC077196]|uniref:LGFP repeat-containing protein n=1 Tax=Leucobacter sp. NPDC077196 TaxID=3154959 RepID=UPI0034165339
MATRMLALLVGGAVGAVALVGVPAQAQAATNPSAGFQPGNIISDANFYNPDAMTSGAIQRFLNARVARCTIGDPGRLPWTKWNGTLIASACLKNAKFTTTTRPANSYCKAYTGKKDESAAMILRKVSRACGISPRVLLIMLEKEQSLVTDTWPTTRQFDFAMGFDCPDSGPGNSANCSSSAGGFAYQLYRGAMQLQVYRANPNAYNYRPFQTNTIQWHPNRSCGTSQVYIENWATAALYIYTPYRPNAASLAAGWGTGDGCSSYGNRNFYNFYKTWFGSATSGYAVHAKLKSLYNSQKSTTGKPTGAAKSISGGIYQNFAKARMYWTSKGGAAVVRGHILPVYKDLGQVSSQLGAPIGVQRTVEKAHNQRFTNGEVFWKKSTGALLVRGTTYRAYKSLGGAAKLGGPTNDQIGSTTRGVMQDFTRGSTRQIITWSAKSNPKIVSGDIRQRFLRDGGLDQLGYAVARANDIPGGKQQRFSKADIYWTDSVSKARSVKGEILKTLRANGGYAKVGLPTSYEFTVDGGVRQNFEKKAIVWTRNGGGKVVSLKTVGAGKSTSGQMGRSGEGADSPETDSPETESPDTESPETESPETESPGPEDQASGDEDASDSATGSADASGADDAEGGDVAAGASDASGPSGSSAAADGATEDGSADAEDAAGPSAPVPGRRETPAPVEP